MALVKEQLCQLTLKNRGMKASMQEMREAVVGELMSIMKTRRIVIEQLGRPDILEEMRKPCKDLLTKRKLHMIVKEEELISLEKLLSGHEAVLEHADSACMELEEKIRAFEQDKIWDPTYTMKGMVYPSILSWYLLNSLRLPANECPGQAHERRIHRPRIINTRGFSPFRRSAAILHLVHGSTS